MLCRTVVPQQVISLSEGRCGDTPRWVVRATARSGVSNEDSLRVPLRSRPVLPRRALKSVLIRFSERGTSYSLLVCRVLARVSFVLGCTRRNSRRLEDRHDHSKLWKQSENRS